MSILIVGADGSMGKRYQAILRALDQPFLLCDQFWSEVKTEEIEAKVSGIILATPTSSHIRHIQSYMAFKKPILCEKPISKDPAEVKEILRDCEVPLHMMYQYKNLSYPWARGESYYDYFRHGNDGLVWDCLQIIGLAQEKVVLKEASPIWKCKINGHHLKSDMMDLAYVVAVEKWLAGERQDPGEILGIHEKTKDLENVY